MCQCFHANRLGRQFSWLGSCLQGGLHLVGGKTSVSPNPWLPLTHGFFMAGSPVQEQTSAAPVGIWSFTTKANPLAPPVKIIIQDDC